MSTPRRPSTPGRRSSAVPGDRSRESAAESSHERISSSGSWSTTASELEEPAEAESPVQRQSPSPPRKPTQRPRSRSLATAVSPRVRAAPPSPTVLPLAQSTPTTSTISSAMLRTVSPQLLPLEVTPPSSTEGEPPEDLPATPERPLPLYVQYKKLEADAKREAHEGGAGDRPWKLRTRVSNAPYLSNTFSSGYKPKPYKRKRTVSEGKKPLIGKPYPKGWFGALAAPVLVKAAAAAARAAVAAHATTAASKTSVSTLMSKTARSPSAGTEEHAAGVSQQQLYTATPTQGQPQGGSAEKSGPSRHSSAHSKERKPEPSRRKERKAGTKQPEKAPLLSPCKVLVTPLPSSVVSSLGSFWRSPGSEGTTTETSPRDIVTGPSTEVQHVIPLPGGLVKTQRNRPHVTSTTGWQVKKRRGRPPLKAAIVGTSPTGAVGKKHKGKVAVKSAILSKTSADKQISSAQQSVKCPVQKKVRNSRTPQKNMVLPVPPNTPATSQQAVFPQIALNTAPPILAWEPKRKSSIKGVVPPLHKKSASKGVVPPLHKKSAGKGVVSPLHKKSASKGVVSPLHKKSAGKGVVSPLHKKSDGKGEVPPLHKKSAGKGEVPPLHKKSAGKGEVPPLHKKSAGKGEVPPLHKKSAGKGEVPSMHKKAPNSGEAPKKRRHDSENQRKAKKSQTPKVSAKPTNQKRKISVAETPSKTVLGLETASHGRRQYLSVLSQGSLESSPENILWTSAGAVLEVGEVSAERRSSRSAARHARHAIFHTTNFEQEEAASIQRTETREPISPPWKLHSGSRHPICWPPTSSRRGRRRSKVRRKKKIPLQLEDGGQSGSLASPPVTDDDTATMVSDEVKSVVSIESVDQEVNQDSKEQVIELPDHLGESPSLQDPQTSDTDGSIATSTSRLKMENMTTIQTSSSTVMEPERRQSSQSQPDSDADMAASPETIFDVGSNADMAASPVTIFDVGSNADMAASSETSFDVGSVSEEESEAEWLPQGRCTSMECVYRSSGAHPKLQDRSRSCPPVKSASPTKSDKIAPEYLVRHWKKYQKQRHEEEEEHKHQEQQPDQYEEEEDEDEEDQEQRWHVQHEDEEKQPQQPYEEVQQRLQQEISLEEERETEHLNTSPSQVENFNMPWAGGNTEASDDSCMPLDLSMSARIPPLPPWLSKFDATWPKYEMASQENRGGVSAPKQSVVTTGSESSTPEISGGQHEHSAAGTSSQLSSKFFTEWRASTSSELGLQYGSRNSETTSSASSSQRLSQTSSSRSTPE